MEICYTIADVRKQVKEWIDDWFCTDHGISA